MTTGRQENSPKHLLIGELLRPHGVRGEIRMRVLTDYPERIPDLEHIFLSEKPEARRTDKHTVEHMRMHKGYALLKLKNFNNRTEVDTLRGLFVMVSLQDAVPLEDDEIYLFQLIGMTVQTEDDVVLGKISDVIETGANDVYVIDSPEYGEILIPVIDETIIETNTDENFVKVRLLDGLLPTKKAN